MGGEGWGEVGRGREGGNSNLNLLFSVSMHSNEVEMSLGYAKQDQFTIEAAVSVSMFFYSDQEMLSLLFMPV